MIFRYCSARQPNALPGVRRSHRSRHTASASILALAYNFNSFFHETHEKYPLRLSASARKKFPVRLFPGFLLPLPTAIAPLEAEGLPVDQRVLARCTQVGSDGGVDDREHQTDNVQDNAGYGYAATG